MRGSTNFTTQFWKAFTKLDWNPLAGVRPFAKMADESNIFSRWRKFSKLRPKKSFFDNFC
jgi:hypothetical protein